MLCCVGDSFPFLLLLPCLLVNQTLRHWSTFLSMVIITFFKYLFCLLLVRGGGGGQSAPCPDEWPDDGQSFNKFHKNMIHNLFWHIFQYYYAIHNRWKNVIEQDNGEFSSCQYDDHLDKFLKATRFRNSVTFILLKAIEFQFQKWITKRNSKLPHTVNLYDSLIWKACFSLIHKSSI